MKRRRDGPANRRELIRRAATDLDDFGLRDETYDVAMTLLVVEENVITGLKSTELTLKRRAQSGAWQATFLITPIEDRHLIVFRSHCQTAVSLKDDDGFVVAKRAIADA